MHDIDNAIEHLERLLAEEDPNQIHRMADIYGRHQGLSPEECSKIQKEIFEDIVPHTLDLNLLKDKLNCLRRDWENYHSMRTRLLMDFAKKVSGENIKKDDLNRCMALYELSVELKESNTKESNQESPTVK